MAAIQQVLLGYGAVSTPGTTWDNILRAGGNITLSGGALTATCTPSALWPTVMATLGRDAALAAHYFEILVSAGSADNMLGLGRSTMDLTHFCGQDSDTYGYYASSGQKYNNNSGAAYGSTYTTGDVIGVALKAGKLWFRKNGTWQNSGDPAAGTGEAFSGITGTVHPCASEHSGATYVGRFTAASFSGSIPSGFSAWS